MNDQEIDPQLLCDALVLMVLDANFDDFAWRFQSIQARVVRVCSHIIRQMKSRGAPEALIQAHVQAMHLTGYYPSSHKHDKEF